MKAKQKGEDGQFIFFNFVFVEFVTLISLCSS